MDTLCARNAFGRQIRWFEEALEIPGIDGPPVRAVFIRAPWLAEYGDAVEILTEVDGHPVAARQDNMLLISSTPRSPARFVSTPCSCATWRHDLLHAPRRVGGQRGRPRVAAAARGRRQPVRARLGAGARGGGAAARRGDRGDPGLALRARAETASAIGEVLGLPFETDPDLHEVRQADAYYKAAPEYGETGTITWMPTAARDFAQPGAESFDTILARVDRVQERLAKRTEQLLCVSHWGFLHFFLGRTIFRDDFAPVHLPALFRISHANTGITIFEQRQDYVIDGVAFDGWALKTWNDQGHLWAGLGAP